MARRARGSGHLFKPRYRTSTGRLKEQTPWWIAYYVQGKLVRENSGTPVKSDAEKLLRARTAAVDEGHLVDPVALKTTLDDLAALVETDYTNNGRRQCPRGEPGL